MVVGGGGGPHTSAEEEACCAASATGAKKWLSCGEKFRDDFHHCSFFEHSRDERVQSCDNKVRQSMD